MAPKTKKQVAKPDPVEDSEGEEDAEFDVNEDVLAKLMAGGGNAALIAAMQAGLSRLVGSSSGYVESLPAPIKNRVNFLKELQEKYDELEEAMEKEVKAIEEKYTKLAEPLIEKRQKVVSGEIEVPENETKEGKKAIAEAEEAVPAGIPDFWSVVLRADPNIDEMVTEKDAEILEYLTNITEDDIEDEDGDAIGFQLTFEFRENPFFTNDKLTVSYLIDDSEDEMSVQDIQGCSIKWNADKDVTVKKMKKKAKPGSKAKPQTKTEPVESFFRFFTDVPAIPDEEEMDDLEEEELEALSEAAEQHLALGMMIREQILPRAVDYFTGEALQEDDDEDDEEYSDEGDEDDDEDDDDDEEGAPKDSKEQPQECKQQ